MSSTAPVRPIDLRSDTVTRPSPEMRRAMAAADVGDDVYGEDPTARALEERAASLLGKEASLFVPSGTMANQIALLLHCRPGDEVIVGEGTHCMFYEGGAGAAWAGVQFVVTGSGGLFTADDMEAAIKPDAYYLPRTRLVVVENTHNRSGGRVWAPDEIAEIARRAYARGLSVHMDGARIWNASVATSKPESELAAPAHTVSACFSKGLGAPAGSVIAGTSEAIGVARRLRRMLGGAMRQVGVLCAGAIYALDHHRARLGEDHDNARRLARALAEIPGLSVALDHVETNIVNVDVERVPAAALSDALAREGLLVHAVSARRIRAVTHLDVATRDIDAAIDIFRRVVGGLR